MLRRHGANDDLPGVFTHTVQPGYILEINEMFGRGQPQLHHRNKAVASRQHPGFVTKTGQQLDRCGDAVGPMVFKWSGDHSSSQGTVLEFFSDSNMHQPTREPVPVSGLIQVQGAPHAHEEVGFARSAAKRARVEACSLTYSEDPEATALRRNSPSFALSSATLA